MTVTRDPDAGTLAKVRFHDPWPRPADWFDTLLPADFGWRGEMHTMRIEEAVEDGILRIRAELPGMDPDKDIDVTIRDGVLTIEAMREETKEREHRSEFFYGKFVRSLTLPPNADASSIGAEYKDGILEVRVSMAPAATAATTKVPISRAA